MLFYAGRKILKKILNFNNITFENLHDPKRYEIQIEKVFNKLLKTKGVGALFEITQENIPVFTFGYDRTELAKTLAETVRKEKFLFNPPQRCIIHIRSKNKFRVIYKFSPLDKIVIGVIGQFLMELLRPYISKHVYSYQKNRSNKDEIEALANYIKKQRKENGHKSFYIVQTDIDSYSDAVNVSNKAYFWNVLAKYFKSLNVFPSEYHWYLITQAIRPDYLNEEGAMQCNIRGLPTGSPITPFLYNFYIASLDDLLTRDPSFFYGRYGDDVILCHHNENYVDECFRKLKIELEYFDLKVSERKTYRYHFSPAGKSSPDGSWKGKNRIDMLGYCISAAGQYAISSTRQKRLLRMVRSKIWNSVSLFDFESIDEKGSIICKMINELITDTTSGNNNFILAMKSCSDVQTLKQIDRLIAQSVAEALSGIWGVKAFQRLGYSKIRNEWGLISLVNTKINLYKQKNISPRN